MYRWKGVLKGGRIVGKEIYEEVRTDGKEFYEEVRKDGKEFLKGGGGRINGKEF